MTNLLIILILISFGLLAYLGYRCVISHERYIRKSQKMQDAFKQQKADRTKIDLKFHDKLGANLSALNLHMNMLKKHIPEQKFQTIHNLLNDSIKETRNISKKIDMAELLTNKN